MFTQSLNTHCTGQLYRTIFWHGFKFLGLSSYSQLVRLVKGDTFWRSIRFKWLKQKNSFFKKSKIFWNSNVVRIEEIVTSLCNFLPACLPACNVYECLPACLWIMYMPGVGREQKKAPGSLKLELQIVVSYRVNSSNQTQGLQKNSQCS